MVIIDELVKIEPQFWPELRNKFLVDWPKNCSGYFTVNNYIEWRQKDPEYNGYEFFSLNNDWINDGTFIVLEENYHIFAFTLIEDLSKLQRIFSLLPLNKKYLLCGVDGRFVKAIRKVFDEFKWEVNLPVTNTYIYRMPKEVAIDFEYTVPKELTLKRLKLTDMNEVDSLYPYRDEKSLLAFQRLQEYNISLGLYEGNEIFNEQRLLGWCLYYQSGQLTALQVKEDAKKRGLATLLVKAMAKKLAKRGSDCVAAVVTTNNAAVSLFEKLRFEDTCNTATWIEFATKIKKEEEEES